MTRKQQIFILASLLVVLALSLSACAAIDIQIESLVGSGNVATEERNVSGFEQILLAGSGDLTITQGEVESLTITTDENLMDYIQSTVDGRVLMLGIDVDDLSDVVTTFKPTRLEYDLVVKDLSSLNLAGSGSASMDGLETTELILTLAGSGSLTIDNLTASRVETNLPGSGNIKLSGSVPDQMVTIAGSGNYSAPNLESTSAHVFIGGSGNVTVWASDDLDIDIAGSGEVGYYGSPTVKQQILGSGEVNSLGNK
jgi:hypothetical protein